MKDYGTTYSSERPEEVDVKSTKVFVASDIKEEKDGGYSYDLTEYDKDEYEAGKKSAPAVRSGEQYFTTLNGYYCKDAAGRALLAELEDIVHPDLVTLNAVQNGVYVPTTSYGYGTVNVNVPFYARTDATLADVSTVEGDEMHIEPTAGTSYYPRLFLMATPSPNPESVAPVDMGKLFEPESGSWAVQPYIDIIDKATGQSVTGYPQQVHTSASFAINSGGYCRVKSWSYASDKISVTTTRWNTTYSDPIDDTYATQNDVDDWCSAYATGPYAIYDDLAKGTCGDNATWVLYKSGQLVISGTGALWSKSQITWDSTKVVDVLVGEGITALGTELFKNYRALKTAHIPSTLTAFGGSCFYGSSIENVDIAPGISSISAYVFQNCTHLTALTLPDTVTYINNTVIKGCSSLTSFTVLATTPPRLNTYGLGLPSGTTIYVPYDSVDAYKTAWSSYADRIQAIQE